MFYVIYVSLNEFGFAARIYTFTLEWYAVVLGDKILVASLEWTGYLALAAVFTAVPMGLLAAKFYKRTRRKVGFVTLMLYILLAQGGLVTLRAGWGLLKILGSMLLGAVVVPLEFEVLESLDRMLGNVEARES